jgi:alpha/beta superfamily hydrolase
VVVIPATDHFFHRRLPILKQLVTRHVLGAEAESAGSNHWGVR